MYILAGLSDDVTSFNPINLGQWVFKYDVSGVILKTYKADHTSSQHTRSSILEDSLNGRLVAVCAHDGILTGIAIDTLQNNLGVFKILYPSNLTYTARTQSFLTCTYPGSTSICAVGRKLYHTLGRKLFVSDILMFDVFTDAMYTNCNNLINMGTLHVGTTTIRKVYIKNISPLYTYVNTCITSNAPGITVSTTGEPQTFGESIKFETELKHEHIHTFFIQVNINEFANTEVPLQIYENLVITSALYWRD